METLVKKKKKKKTENKKRNASISNQAIKSQWQLLLH